MAQAQNPWEVDWSQQGGPATATPPDMVISRPDPVADARSQAQLEIERARLDALRIANARAGQNAPPPGFRYSAEGNLEFIPGGPADPANANRANSGDQRIANLRALERQIADVRSQYERNFRGGAPNAIVGMLPNLIRPENGQFDSAGQGMADTGNAAFRVPGTGTTSDADAARFVAANTPQAGDSDQVIEQKLRNLSTRLEETYRAMGLGPGGVPLGQQQAPQRNDQPAAATIPTGGAGGPPSGPVDPFGQGGPVALPTARGAHGDAGIGANGVVDAASGQGMRVVPELYGLGGEISSLIQQGATREQVLAHYQDRMQRAGAPITMGQVAIINEVVQKHQQFPNAPVASLASGWDNFHMQPTANTGGSLLGQIADSTVGAGLIGAANGVTGGGLRAVSGDQGRSVIDYSQNERPVSTFIGDALGTTGAMVATSGGANALARTGAGLATRGGMLGRAGGAVGRLAQAASRGNGVMLDTGYGAVRGAVEADPGNGVVGALGGAFAGAAGNAVGQGMANVVGRGVRGVTDPSVRYLADRGINMSLGQMLGNSTGPGRFFNKLESIPVVGDMMAARRADSIGDYGRAQLAENLAPIGYRPPAGPFNQAMLGDAQNAISNAYRQTFDGVNITPDSQFAQEAGAALRQGEGVVDMGQKFRQLMDNQVGNLFDTPTGQLDGPQLQAALSRTREIGASLRGTGDPVAPLVGDAADQFGNALNGLVERQAPGTIPQLRAANQAYAGLVPIENAAITGTNNGGLFTPAQYGRAAVNNTRRFGGRGAAARGDVPGGELQRHAQDIIPSTIPDSGTAGRGMAAMLLPAALGGSAIGAGTFTDHPIASAGLGALALLSTRGGSRALQRTMMGGARRQRLGQALLDNQSNAGLLGSALLIPAYSASGQ